MGQPRRGRRADRHHRLRPGRPRRRRVRAGPRPSVPTVSAGDSFGEIESTKSVSDVYAPVSGIVVEVNEALADGPQVAQRGSLRRRLDLHDPHERPGAVRRPARRRLPTRRSSRADDGLRLLQPLRPSQPARQQLLLELRLAARRQRRPHDHAHRRRPAAGRPGAGRRCRGAHGRPTRRQGGADRPLGHAGRRPLRPRRPTSPASAGIPTARSCSTTSPCPVATPRSSAPTEGYVVTDAGSLNGTYVNQERIDRAVLHHGDELQVGKFRLVLFERADA